MIFNLSICLGAVGVTMEMLALLGHRVGLQCLSEAVVTVKNKKRFLSFFNILLLVCMAIFRQSLAQGVAQAMSQMSYTLERGMAAYLLDKHWKSSLNLMQSRMQCCGANNYTDWYRVSWIPIESLNVDAPNLEKYVRPNGRVTAPLLPFSCCRPHYLGVCHHDLLPQKTPGVGSFYTRGCVEQVTGQLSGVVDSLTGAAVGYGLLTAVASVLLSFLYTSSRNGWILGRETSPGWLYGPEDVGYGAEDTLLSIDESEETNQASSEQYKRTGGKVVQDKTLTSISDEETEPLLT